VIKVCLFKAETCSSISKLSKEIFGYFQKLCAVASKCILDWRNAIVMISKEEHFLWHL
jgi:hypothetical protein